MEGGSSNDYDYVSGDPINRFDLSGTVCFSCAWEAVKDTVTNPIETFKDGYDGMSPTGQAMVEATVEGSLGGLSVAVPVAAASRVGMMGRLGIHSAHHAFR